MGLSVYVFVNISPLECLFVLKAISRTHRATKVKKFVGFSLKSLHCRDLAPSMLTIRTVGHFKAHALGVSTCGSCASLTSAWQALKQLASVFLDTCTSNCAEGWHFSAFHLHNLYTHVRVQIYLLRVSVV